MPLEVIGSGFGRTGTASLKRALETLGFGPCHHMEEVMANPEQVTRWEAYVAGEPVRWDDVFDGYRSQVDWPGAHVWRELAQAYPDAKVIHSVRPEDAWWKSFSAAALPPERLLVFDVTEGWEPLCAFLGVPVPDAPFPHVNSAEEFWQMLDEGKPLLEEHLA
jgi:hypothetical protein